MNTNRTAEGSATSTRGEVVDFGAALQRARQHAPSMVRPEITLLVEPPPVKPKRKARKKPQKRRWAWWSLPTCGSGLVVREAFTGTRTCSGGRCGCAGCPHCEPGRRMGVLGVLSDFRLPEELGAYMVTLTPKKRLRTAPEVAAWIDHVTATYKQAQDSGWWLGGAVSFEVVAKPDEPSSEIACPVRWGVVPADLRGESREAGAAMKAACLAGDCTVCGGTGLLPAAHVHAHLLVFAAPFWYGRGNPVERIREVHADLLGVELRRKRAPVGQRGELRAEERRLRKSLASMQRAIDEGWRQAPGGAGARDWLEARDFQCFDFRRLDNREAGVRYLSKVAARYASKVAGDDDVRAEISSTQQLDAFHVSAAYLSGRKSVRLWGFLYGHGRKMRDPAFRTVGLWSEASLRKLTAWSDATGRDATEVLGVLGGDTAAEVVREQAKRAGVPVVRVMNRGRGLRLPSGADAPPRKVLLPEGHIASAAGPNCRGRVSWEVRPGVSVGSGAWGAMVKPVGWSEPWAFKLGEWTAIGCGATVAGCLHAQNRRQRWAVVASLLEAGLSRAATLGRHAGCGYTAARHWRTIWGEVLGLLVDLDFSAWECEALGALCSRVAPPVPREGQSRCEWMRDLALASKPFKRLCHGDEGPAWAADPLSWDAWDGRETEPDLAVYTA